MPSEWWVAAVRLPEGGYRYRAFGGETLPVKFDTFDLVQSLGRQVALSTVTATHHRNILNDQQILA